MVIKSNPSLRDDYYESSSEIRQIQDSVNVIASDLTLFQGQTNDNFTNVNQTITDLENSYNEQIVTNLINANVGNFNHLMTNVSHTNKATIEDLTVSKMFVEQPITDIMINNAHIDNIACSGGTIYNTDITGARINVNYPKITTDDILGFDENGSIIPVHAIYDYSLPNNADYLSTDSDGTPISMQATQIIDNSQLLPTSRAVMNMGIEVNAQSYRELQKFSQSLIYFPELLKYKSVTKVLYSPSFNGNSFFTPFGDNYIFNYNTTSGNLLFSTTSFNYSTKGLFKSCPNIDEINMNLFEYTTSTREMFAKCRSLNCPITIPYRVLDASDMFRECTNFNQPIIIPDSVLDTRGMFSLCTNFNQPITIPDSVEYASGMFSGCTNFNQPITLGNKVEFTLHMFSETNFNQPITIPDSVLDTVSMFFNCRNLNQPITLGNNIVNALAMFSGCTNFNQPIIIPNNVLDTSEMFWDCTNFNQPIIIPNNVLDTSEMFSDCTNFNQPIIIPNNVLDTSGMFRNCTNFNQPIIIPNKVESTYQMFSETTFNQPITIPDSVLSTMDMFYDCYNLNSDVSFYTNTTTNISTIFMFKNCNSMNANIYITSEHNLDNSDYLYKALTNNSTGVNFYGRVFNTL